MAEQLPDLRSRLIIDDSQVAEVLGKVGKQSETMGQNMRKGAEMGRLGLWGLGEAAEESAKKMGIPNQAARQLGNAVEGVASRFSKYAAVLGGVGLAVAGGIAIWNKYKESQEAARNEAIKYGQQAGTWIEAQLKDQGATKELTEAKRALARAEFDLNKQRAEAAIPALVQQLSELTEKYNDLSDVAGGGKTPLFMTTEAGENVFEAAARKAKGLKLEINQLAGQLQVARAQAGMYGGDSRSRVGGDGGAGDQEWANMIAFSQAHMKYEQDSLEASRQYTADQAMLTQARIDDANREAEVKREAFYSTVSFMSSSFQAMYQAGGSHARKSFSLFKIAASAEALINADRAAASSYAWGAQLGGPMLGATLAGLAYLAGMARVKSIRAMTLEGGGGAGGAVPTYSASPTTGAPTSSGPSSLIININGQRAGEYELAGGLLRTIYNNNGSVDGFTLEVARSA